MQKISKNKGITLVSLIVTIIILMILAGVVISTVTGNNGILSKSKFARDTYKNSANEENNVLSKYENEIDKASLDVASSREDTVTLTSEEYNSLISRIEKLEKNNTNISTTKLWEGDISQSGQKATLNDSIENYKYLILKSKWEATSCHLNILDVQEILQMGYNKNIHDIISLYDSYYYFIEFSDSKTAFIPANYGTNCHLVKIEGIK